LSCHTRNVSNSEHTTYDAAAVADYLIAATRAAQVLTEYRAPYRGRLTPVNAWWGSFDLAVSLFSGRSAKPPSNDFIMRNSMDVQEVAVGWWPGDARYPRAAFYAYAYPAPDGFAAATLEPAAARWDSSLGEYLLDWDDARDADDPHATALAFARSAYRRGCTVGDWDAALAAMTVNPARIWGLDDYGTLEPGKDADVVIWDGDPLQVTAAAERVFIRGLEMPRDSRQIRLRDRYRPHGP